MNWIDRDFGHLEGEVHNCPGARNSVKPILVYYSLFSTLSTLDFVLNQLKGL